MFVYYKFIFYNIRSIWSHSSGPVVYLLVVCKYFIADVFGPNCYYNARCTNIFDNVKCVHVIYRVMENSRYENDKILDWHTRFPRYLRWRSLTSMFQSPCTGFAVRGYRSAINNTRRIIILHYESVAANGRYKQGFTFRTSGNNNIARDIRTFLAICKILLIILFNYTKPSPRLFKYIIHCRN